MSNAKHLKLVEKHLYQRFLQISSELKFISTSENETLVRKLVDERRQVLDGLESYKFDESKEGGVTAQTKSFIEMWVKKVLVFGKPDELPQYLGEPDFCNAYIDYLVPLTWNWEKDWLVLVRPNHEMLIASLSDRGQKYILVFDPDADEKQYDLLEKGSFHLVRKIQQINDFFDFHMFPISRMLGVFCNSAKPSDQERLEINTAIKTTLVKHRINQNTSSALSSEWIENFLQNSKFLQKTPHISELKISGFDTAIVVAPGPSLNKNIKELKKYGDKALIISVLHALPKLIKEKIEPHVVIHVDAKLDKPLVEYLKKHMNFEIPLFVASANLPKSFNEIPRKKTVWTELVGAMHSELCNLLNVSFPHITGGNVSLYAFNLCAAWNFKNIVLIGQDLSYDGDKYYADSDGLKTAIEVKEEHSDKRVEVDGYFGGKVKTSSDFFLYLGEFKRWAGSKFHSNIRHINCTEGGARIEGFEHIKFCDLDSIFSEKQTELKIEVNFGNERKEMYQNFFSAYFDNLLAQTKIFLEHVNVCARVTGLKKVSAEQSEKRLNSEEELKKISGNNKLLESYLANLIIGANTLNSGTINKMTPKEFYSKLRREVFKLRSSIIEHRH
jgi:hypothetical protein